MRQFFYFVIVGGINTVVMYGLYCFFLYLGFHYQLALLLEYAFGTVLGYTLNRRWTFGEQGKTPAGFTRYLTTYLGIYFCNVMLLATVVEMGWMTPMLGQIIILAVISLVNFLLQKFWVFRKAKATN